MDGLGQRCTRTLHYVHTVLIVLHYVVQRVRWKSTRLRTGLIMSVLAVTDM